MVSNSTPDANLHGVVNFSRTGNEPATIKNLPIRIYIETRGGNQSDIYTAHLTTNDNNQTVNFPAAQTEQVKFPSSLMAKEVRLCAEYKQSELGQNKSYVSCFSSSGAGQGNTEWIKVMPGGAYGPYILPGQWPLNTTSLSIQLNVISKFIHVKVQNSQGQLVADANVTLELIKTTENNKTIGTWNAQTAGGDPTQNPLAGFARFSVPSGIQIDNSANYKYKITASKKRMGSAFKDGIKLGSDLVPYDPVATQEHPIILTLGQTTTPVNNDKISIQLALQENLALDNDLSPLQKFRAAIFWKALGEGVGDRDSVWHTVMGWIDDFLNFRFLPGSLRGDVRAVIQNTMFFVFDRLWSVYGEGGITSILQRDQFVRAFDGPIPLPSGGGISAGDYYQNYYDPYYRPLTLLTNLYNKLLQITSELAGNHKPKTLLFKKIPLHIQRGTGAATDNQMDRTNWKIAHTPAGNEGAITWTDTDPSCTGGYKHERGCTNSDNKYSWVEIDKPANWDQLDERAKELYIKEQVNNMSLGIDTDGDSYLSYRGAPDEMTVGKISGNPWKFKVTYNFYAHFNSDAGRRFLNGIDNKVTVSFRPVASDRSQNGESTSSLANQGGGLKIADVVGLKIDGINGTNFSQTYQFQDSMTMFSLANGTYQASTVTPRNNIYTVDPRNNNFTVDFGTGNSPTLAFCYTENAYQDNGRLKYLGEYNYTLYNLLSMASNRETNVLNQARVSNLVYAGNMKSTDNFNTPEGLTFCRMQGHNPTDTNLSGKTVVVTDQYLAAVHNTYGDITSDDLRKTGEMIDYQSGELYYNQQLNNISRDSWTNIMRAAQLSGDQSKIFSAVAEASEIQNYVSNDAYVQDAKVFGYTLAALKNSALLEQRMQEMNEAAKYTLEAMIQFVDKSVNNNDHYQATIDLSNTPISTDQIQKGQWLTAVYRNLSSTAKISIKYAQLIARIRNAGPINSLISTFNRWVDALLGARDTGAITGTVTSNDQPVANAIVKIGEKVGRTNSQGAFTISRISVGAQPIEVDNKDTGVAYGLVDPDITANVVKSQTRSVDIQIISQ
jgi:hypothetical protein